MPPRRRSTDYSLAVLFPDLAAQWHPTKNGDLTPYDITHGSHRRVWWKCDVADDHEWQAKPRNRSFQKTGCPFCAGLRVSPTNSLASLHPEIAARWHPTKNGQITPGDVTANSKTKVWWKCPAADDHFWEAPPNRLVQNAKLGAGTGCPYCTGKKVTPNESLARVNPGLAEEWHPTKNGNLTPSEVRPMSARKVWWRCRNNSQHEWRALVSNRSHGTGCPYCSHHTSRLEIAVYCELKTLFSGVEWRNRDFGPEVDILLTHDGVAIEVDGSHWHKNGEDHDRRKSRALEEAGLTVVRLREHPLPKLSDQDVQHGQLDDHLAIVKQLVTRLGEIHRTAKHADRLAAYLERETLSNANEAEEIESYLPGPPPGQSLADLRPEVAAQWHPNKNGLLTPRDVWPSSARPVWWQCEVSAAHEWEMAPSIRRGCPFCSGYRVGPDNCLAFTDPELASEWHPTQNGPLAPSDVTRGSDKKVWWKCPAADDHKWTATVCSRAVNSQGCPFCSGNAVTRSNCLATTHPDIAAQWHPTKNGTLTPSDVTPGSGKKVWWKCPVADDHEWEAAPGTRTSMKSGCPCCSNHKRVPSNSLAATHPELAAEWHPTLNGDLKPTDVHRGSRKKVWWKCPLADDHEWIAAVAWRATRNRQGCPCCSRNRVDHSISLASTHPDIAAQWHPTKNGSLTPSDVTYGSNRKVWWKCPVADDHEWEATLSSRTSSKSGCPCCSGHKRVLSNSLAATHPRLAAEWHPTLNGELKPTDITRGSNRKVWWKCPVADDHEWEATPGSRTSMEAGCPYCAGNWVKRARAARAARSAEKQRQ